MSKSVRDHVQYFGEVYVVLHVKSEEARVGISMVLTIAVAPALSRGQLPQLGLGQIRIGVMMVIPEKVRVKVTYNIPMLMARATPIFSFFFI